MLTTKLYAVVFGIPRSEVAERARSFPSMLAAMAYRWRAILLVGLARVRVAVDRRARGPIAEVLSSGASPISVPADVLDRTVSFQTASCRLRIDAGGIPSYCGCCARGSCAVVQKALRLHGIAALRR